MKKITLLLIPFLLIGQSIPANADESIRYKSTQSQTIKKGKWVTLDFNGKKQLKGNGNRSLFCYQVGLNMKGKKKPKYVKVRLARVKEGRKLDTTATNYYPITSKPSKEFVGAGCWAINTNSPVVLQVRITGGSKSYRSDIRQFKMWTPGADYPADFSDFLLPQ